MGKRLSLKPAGYFLILVILLGSLFGGSPRSARAQTVSLQPEVILPSGWAETPALRDLPASTGAPAALRETPRFNPHPAGLLAPQAQTFSPDPVLQPAVATGQMPATVQNFEGIGNVSLVLPADPNGDIGFDPATGKKYFVQWVNLVYSVWDVTGTPTQVLAPLNGKQIWSSLGAGSLCSTNGMGDPVILFDSLANRWFFSQFAFTLDLLGNPIVPSYQCVAVSKTADPTGAYSLYSYAWPNNKFNDYSKWGVWADAYYMSTNQYSGVSYSGAGVAAFDRAAMLAGSPTAAMVSFDLAGTNMAFGGMLPSDLDGQAAPPAGAPAVFVEVDDSTSIGPSDALRLWNFHVDWATPANSTFGTSHNPDQVLPVASYNQLPCVTTAARNCVTQPGSAPGLDGVADRLMFRLAYRNLGDHQALVVNHTVWADGADRAGIRWYELRSTGGPWAIFQQGTYAPADGDSRWMGSAAMDRQGNLAIGFSVSGPNTYPSVRYAGRLVSDPPGVLGQTEASIIEGKGAQLDPTARWGDYSSLNVDPQDDCTFWYSHEYYSSTSAYSWQTRIGAFKFPNCTTGTLLSGTVKDGTAGGHTWPLYARVDVSGAGVSTSVFTDPVTGAYSLSLAQAGPYTLTATALIPGYSPAALANYTLPPVSLATQNFSLAAEPVGCLAPGYQVQPPANTCAKIPGGLIVGSVLDQNTAAGINGATVSTGSTTPRTAQTFATPTDPAQPDGFYTLFAPTGAQSITASMAGGYQSQMKRVTVAAEKAVRQDYSLVAGLLGTTPAPGVFAQVDPGKATQAPVVLNNTGTAPVNYSLTQLPAPAAWLSLSAASGTIAPGSSHTITLTMNASGLLPGLYGVTLHVTADTPYPVTDIPVQMAVGTVVFLPMVGR